MICPYCYKPNRPHATVCENCLEALPSKAELREMKKSFPKEMHRQRVAIFARAVVVSLIVTLVYYFAINAVGILWILRFNATIPAGISEAEYAAMYDEAFSHDSGYLDIIFSCVCVLAVAVYFAIQRRSLSEAANIRPAPSVKLGAAFVCGLTLQIPMGFIISAIPFPQEIFDGHEALMTSRTAPLIVQMLYSVILAPIIEEIFFRGIAHDRAARVMPVPIAAAVSSAGFALIHGEPIAILVAFACGYFLAIMYSRFETILVPIAFHIGFNLFSFVLGFITNDTVLLIAMALSVVLFITSLCILFRRDTKTKSNQVNGDIQ